MTSNPSRTPRIQREAASRSIYAPSQNPTTQKLKNANHRIHQHEQASPMDIASPIYTQAHKKLKPSESFVLEDTPRSSNPKNSVTRITNNATLLDLDQPESESDEESRDVIGNSVFEAGTPVSTDQQLDPATGEEKKCKPIDVQSGYTALQPIISAMTLKKRPTLKIRNSRQTQIICTNVEDKEKIIEKLKLLKIQHFYYKEKNEKPILFVLKGLPPQRCQEVLTTLIDEGIPADKVTSLSNNPDYPVFLAHFKRGAQSVTLRLLHQRRALNNIIVTWEAYDFARKKLTQCSKCHRHGHPASGCNMTPRCIKCLLSHDAGMCARQSRTQEGSPQCVNCSGNHAANSRICPAFISYSKMVNSHRAPPRPALRHVSSNINHQIHRASPTYAYTQENFPNLANVTEFNRTATIPQMRIPNLSQPNLQHVRVEQTEQSSSPQISNLFDELAHAQRRINTLPNIENTIRNFIAFANDLANAKSESERRILLIQYSFPNAN